MERTKDGQRKCNNAKSNQVKSGSRNIQEGFAEYRIMEKLSTCAKGGSAKPSNDSYECDTFDGPQRKKPDCVQTAEKENVDSNPLLEDEFERVWDKPLEPNEKAYSKFQCKKSTRTALEEGTDVDEAFHLHHRIQDWAVIRYEKHIFLEGNVCDTDGTKHLYRTSGINRVSSSGKTVFTVSGSSYELVGDMFVKASLDAGVPVDVAQKFVKGFPADWKSYRLQFLPPARPHSQLSNVTKPKLVPKSRTTKKKGKGADTLGPNQAILPPTPPTDAFLDVQKNDSVEKNNKSPPAETSDSRSGKTERKRKSTSTPSTSVEKTTVERSNGLECDNVNAGASTSVAEVPDSVGRPKRAKKAKDGLNRGGDPKKKKKIAGIANESACLTEDNTVSDQDDIATTISTTKDASSPLIVEVQFDNFASTNNRKRGKGRRKPSPATTVDSPEVSETPTPCHRYPTRQVRSRDVTIAKPTTRSGRAVRKPRQYCQPIPEDQNSAGEAAAKKKSRRENGGQSSKTLFAEPKTAENTGSESEEISADRLSGAVKKARKRSRKPSTGGRSQSRAKAANQDGSGSVRSQKCSVLLSPLQERHYEGLVVGNISLTAEDKSDRGIAGKDAHCEGRKSAATAKSSREGKAATATTLRSSSTSKKTRQKGSSRDSEAAAGFEAPAASARSSRKEKAPTARAKSRSKKTRQEGGSDNMEATVESEMHAVKPSQKRESRSRSKRSQKKGCCGSGAIGDESAGPTVAAKPNQEVKASTTRAPKSKSRGKKTQQNDRSGCNDAVVESEVLTQGAASQKTVSPRKKRKPNAKANDSAPAEKPARKATRKRKARQRKDSDESSETIVTTPQKDFWNSHRKGRLRKMVYQYLTWDEIGACLKVSPAKCKKVFKDMQSKRKEKKPDSAKPAPVTARRGTLKHREEMRQYLGDATTRSNLPKQDIFHGQVEDRSNDPFFAAMCEDDGFVPVTPNSRPPWLETDCTTPAWFKTPTGQPDAHPSHYDKTPAALKEIWYQPTESGNEQAAKKETDRVILQLGKKMAKGGARLAKSSKVATPRKRKKRNSVALDTIGTTDSSTYESGGEKDDYFDLENE